MRNISNRYHTEKRKRMSTFGGGYQSFDYANNYRGGGGVGASGSGFGGGGFGGGGYMSDVTVAGGGFSSPSVVQSPGMTKSRSGRDDSVRSIVSAQLHSIPLADISSQEIKIDDKELGQVCLVGEIVYVSENSTGTTYKIDDRTGPPIEIKRWISDDVFFFTCAYIFVT
jgi:replication factor A2